MFFGELMVPEHVRGLPMRYTTGDAREHASIRRFVESIIP
jgi:hypothetical protein